MKQRFRIGKISFQDPLILCGALAILLYFDASGFLRVGLLAAVLHEMGHIMAYLFLRHRLPHIEVTHDGILYEDKERALFGKRAAFTGRCRAGVNILLAVWAVFCFSRRATIWWSAFFAANLLTGAFNLLPIPPLDGAQILRCLMQSVPRK